MVHLPIMTTFEKNRGIARTFFPSMIEQGLSSNQALGFLKDQGIGYRRQNFLDDWREFQGLELKKDTFKYIRKELKPTERSVTTTSENLSKEYSYTAKVGVQNVYTGEIEYHQWRYATDQLVSIEEAESEIWGETKEPLSGDPQFEYLSVEIFGVKKSVVL